MIEGS